LVYKEKGERALISRVIVKGRRTRERGQEKGGEGTYKVEDAVAELLSLLRRHDLNLDSPRREVSGLDRVKEILGR
jgi:hypothetical protein